jgi:hypothetical protein
VTEEQIAQPGQQGMAVADLWCTPTIPFEGLVGIAWHRGVISLDDHHLMASPSEGQCRGQSTDPSADNKNLHASIVPEIRASDEPEPVVG